MRKVLRFLVVTSGLVVVGLAVAAWLAWRASQQVPDFYQEVLVLESPELEKAGDELERQVLNLRNEVIEEGTWQAEFTDEQINAWLAYDLPEKFSKSLPKGVTDPRVVIKDGQAQVACRYDSSRFSSVVSLGLAIHLTPEPNVIAVRVEQLKAGALPLPLKSFLDKISVAARRGDLDLRWQQIGGDPVALLTIPAEHERYKNRRIRLTSVELYDGRIVLSGVTEEPDPDDGRVAARSQDVVAKVTVQR